MYFERPVILVLVQRVRNSLLILKIIFLHEVVIIRMRRLKFNGLKIHGIVVHIVQRTDSVIAIAQTISREVVSQNKLLG